MKRHEVRGLFRPSNLYGFLVVEVHQLGMVGADSIQDVCLGWYGCWTKNRGILTPKWMVKIMENPIKIDDLGVALFLEAPIWCLQSLQFYTWSIYWSWIYVLHVHHNKQYLGTIRVCDYFLRKGLKPLSRYGFIRCVKMFDRLVWFLCFWIQAVLETKHKISLEIDVTPPPKTNMNGWKINPLKMYFLLKIWDFPVFRGCIINVNSYTGVGQLGRF